MNYIGKNKPDGVTAQLCFETGTKFSRGIKSPTGSREIIRQVDCDI